MVIHLNRTGEKRNLRGWLGTEILHKTFDSYYCEQIEDSDYFAVEQMMTRKYRVPEKLYYRITDDGLPEITAKPDVKQRGRDGKFMSTKPEAYQVRTEKIDSFNQDYIIRNPDNARRPWEWNLYRLFKDAMADRAMNEYLPYFMNERPEIEEPTIPEAPEFSESDPHQTTTDVIGKCKQSEEDEILVSGKYIFEDSWSDFSKRDSSGEKITPFAITHSDGDDFVLVFEASFDCNQKVEKVNVYPSNDTLYAKTETSVIESVKLESNEGCGCMTRAAFKLKNEGAYAEAKYMVFDNHMEYVYTIAEGTEK